MKTGKIERKEKLKLIFEDEENTNKKDLNEIQKLILSEFSDDEKESLETKTCDIKNLNTC